MYIIYEKCTFIHFIYNYILFYHYINLNNILPILLIFLTKLITRVYVCFSVSFITNNNFIKIN